MNPYRTFAAIIYVTEIERQAVMRMYDWQDLYVQDDEQEYMEAFIEKEGRKVRLVCAQQDEMGMTASAALTSKMINLFTPEYVVMPGIAAGTGEITGRVDQEYGDVLLADSVWNYSNGKYVSPHGADIVFGEIGFNPRPTMVKVVGDHLDAIVDYAKTTENEFYVHVGPLASGAAVVSNTSILKKRVLSGFKDTEGVEMEGYGIAYAANHAISPKPHVIIAKSVCDFADERKDDKYQKFAAYTSCGFIKDVLEKVLRYTGI